MAQWLQSLRVYLDSRMLALLALGFSSGLPRLLVYSTLTFWLLEEGLDIESVGLFAATALPYNLKFIWAPLLDRFQLPAIGDRLGLRRGWLLCIQLALAAAIAVLSFTQPGTEPLLCAMVAVIVSTLSASQDVVIDAYRVEILEDDEQGAGAAVAVFGYRLGMLVASAGALYLAAWSESWPTTYTVMSAAMVVGIAATLLTFEPEHPEPDEDLVSPLDHIRDAVWSPLADFTARRGWLLILCFVLLYKLGDALAGTMTNPFLVDLEFSNTQIANIAKSYGLVASIVGVVVGGTLVRKFGIIRALWVAGAVQLASNLMFSYQAFVGKDATVLIATIGIENLTGGLATAAFVAYLSALCNKRYTATQYALLTAFSSLLQTLASTSSGYLAASTGWFDYFILTTIAGRAWTHAALLDAATRSHGARGRQKQEPPEVICNKSRGKRTIFMKAGGVPSKRFDSSTTSRTSTSKSLGDVRFITHSFEGDSYVEIRQSSHSRSDREPRHVRRDDDRHSRNRIRPIQCAAVCRFPRSPGHQRGPAPATRSLWIRGHLLGPSLCSDEG